MKTCTLTFSSLAGLCFVCQAHATSSVTSIRQRRSNCGARLFGETGIIESPNYPDYYPSNVECVWEITVAENSRIVLTFEAFELEDGGSCTYDYLAVRDGDASQPLRWLLCGDTIPLPVESAGNELIVKFRSDSSSEYSGFRARFRKVTDCGGELTSEEGDVTSPFYPHKYEKNHHCVWVIKVPINYQVKLRFRSFQLESSPSCEDDFLEIRDGPELLSPLLGTFCGSNLPRDTRSSVNSITIRFKTDDRREYRGFSVHFMKVQPVLPDEPPPPQKLGSVGIRNLPTSLTTHIAVLLIKFVLM